MRRIPCRTRGFTLVELLVSASVTVVLVGGIASAMLLAGQALPDGQSPSEVVVQAFDIAEGTAGELYSAESFTVRTATAVEFSVADRDNDLSPEVIRYEWSGTAGDPLTRQYNGATAVEVLPNVHEFNLNYVIGTISETTTETGTTQGDEVLLASFDGWAGVTATGEDRFLTTTSWVSEYFQVTGAPAEATELVFTKAQVMVRSNTMIVPMVGMSAGIHRPLVAGGYVPAATSIVQCAEFLPTMGASFAWAEAPFPSVPITDLSDPEYCLVLKGNAAADPFWAQAYYNSKAPTDGGVMTWTADGGASWDPSAKYNQRDLRFYVYGSFASTGTVEVTMERYFVRAVAIALQVGEDAKARVETSAQILNEPEVASP
ncbi:MAG: prepilin-type N-terminal cleavage/methylation domain-containing protein [Phycisphaerales bacterium]|nr:MAG: prepilin-type N-terminal cleavage/methylation domain-containing protein [Phycisphaerales bacterium]